MYTRQEGILPQNKIVNGAVTIIGSGAIGSFSSLTLVKMGVKHLVIYDEDGVTSHNLPNQFFRKKDIGQFKVTALADILNEFSGTKITAHIQPYVKQQLKETTIVATDSMSSRRSVWEQFKQQPQAKNLIEARMGAELGLVYIIKKINGKIPKKLFNFYESRLYKDEDVKPLPCTAKAIIYNILMISSLICRAYKSIIMNEKMPNELIFNMTSIDERSYMCTTI